MRMPPLLGNLQSRSWMNLYNKYEGQNHWNVNWFNLQYIGLDKNMWGTQDGTQLCTGSLPCPSWDCSHLAFISFSLCPLETLSKLPAQAQGISLIFMKKYESVLFYMGDLYDSLPFLEFLLFMWDKFNKQIKVSLALCLVSW